MKIRTILSLALVAALVISALWLPELLLRQAQRQTDAQIYHQDASDHILADTTPSILETLSIATQSASEVFRVSGNVDAEAITEAVEQSLAQLYQYGAISLRLYDMLHGISYHGASFLDLSDLSFGILVDAANNRTCQVFTAEITGYSGVNASLILDADSLMILSMEIWGAYSLYDADLFDITMEGWASYYGLTACACTTSSQEDLSTAYESALADIGKASIPSPLIIAACTLQGAGADAVRYAIILDPFSEIFRFGTLPSSLGSTETVNEASLG